MKKLLCLLFIVMMNLGFSQEKVTRYSYNEYLFKPNSTVYLFANNVRLREQPTVASKEITLLPINSKIELLERTEIQQKINGINATWIKIKAENQVGYILDNFISLATYKENDTVFLVSVKKIKEDTFCVVRTIEEGSEEEKIVESAYKIPHEDIEIQFYGNKGLQGVTKIIYIDYIAEACGVEGGGKYLLLKGNNVQNELEIEAISDAGVFWKQEKIVFPEDDKRMGTNTIQFVQEIGNVVDESSGWYDKKITERRHRLIDGVFVPAYKSELNAFYLPKPNVEEIQKKLEETNYKEDEVVIYLNTHFGKEVKISDKKYDEYATSNLCAFKKVFESKITYSVNSCGEGKGASNKVVFPKTSKENIVQWIEQIYKSSPSSIKNTWRANNTKYWPEDDGAGCYYEIMETEENTIVKIYCGC